MRASIVRTIFLKELLDTFRDRRTLMAMLGVPIVLYPALFILATQVTLVQESKMAEKVSKVAVTGEESALLTSWLEGTEKIELVELEDAESALDAGDLDAIVSAEPGTENTVEGGGTGTISISYDSTESGSRSASRRVEDALRERRDELLKGRISAEGLVETFAKPIKLEMENVAPPEKSTGSILGSILPLMMVVMLGVGAFYPAVDLTAGEKERGTFETLLSTPTSKLEIIFGKFFAVFSLSMLTGLLNLVSMIVTLLFQLSQIKSQMQGTDFPLGNLEVPPQAILMILIVLIPLAFFISAVMMGVALLARSFKEAQNYVTPFFLAIILPASAVAVPGVELTESTQFIPIANVSLLFRDLMMGKAALDAVFIVFLTTTVYAVLGLIAATWLFQREEVVLSEESGIPLTFNRSILPRLSNPTLGLSLGIFAVVMLLIFYVGSYAQARSIHSGLIVTLYGLILTPVLLALWYGKIDFRNALNLHVPRGGAILGTLLMAPAWVIVIIQIGFYHNKILPAPPEFAEMAEKLFDLSTVPGGLIGLLLIVAVSPAICEEVLFRGLLVSGFRQRMGKWAVILCVGILFGFFHLSIYRLISTGVSGIFLTYLVVRSGSIFPAMFAHFTLNGLSVLIETKKLPSFLVEYLENSDIDETGLPWWLVGVSIAVFAVGVMLMERKGRADASP